MKQSILHIITLIFLCNQALFSAPKLSSNLEYISYKKETERPAKKKALPKILTICSLGGRGGTEMSCVWQHQALIDAGYAPLILVRRGTPLQDAVIEHRIAHYLTDAGTKVPLDAMIEDVREICIKEKVALIQTHILSDLERAARAVTGLRTKLVFTHHSYRYPEHRALAYATGIIAVNKKIAQQIKENQSFHHKVVQHIFPFFDEKKFLNYTPPQLTQNDFFESYGISNKNNLPVICMVGNFYSPEEKPNDSFVFEKNQELLLRALHHFVYQKQKPFHVIFAGSGPSKKWHEDLSAKLGLDEYAHFLGHCPDTRPLLYFSHFHILSSACEASGIAHVEAGLMKKITLGATKTGATEVIIHGKTGFIFENNDLASLIETLDFLLDNPEHYKSMGEKTLPFLVGKIELDGNVSTFSTKYKTHLLEEFYRKVLTINPTKKNPVVPGSAIHLEDRIKAYDAFVRNRVEEYFKSTTPA